MKNLIFTTCIGSPEVSIALPIHKMYCEKYNIDFIVQNKRKLNFHSIGYEKFEILDLFKYYDRILYLDADVLITPNCPNVFEVHDKYDTFYAFHESENYPGNDRDSEIYNALADDDCPFINWPTEKNSKLRYFNVGLFMASKCHSDFLHKVFYYTLKLKSNTFCEQTVLNYIISKYNVKYKSMDQSWNRCDMGRPDPNLERYHANFIHYAGAGYGKYEKNKWEVLKEDIKNLYGEKFINL